MITSFTLEPRYGYKMAKWWLDFFTKRKEKWEKKVKELDETKIEIREILVPTKRCLIILFSANSTDMQLVLHGEDHKYDKQYWNSLQMESAVTKTDIMSHDELRTLLQRSRPNWEIV